MKLVHWPLMGGLLHLVQWGGYWVGWGPAQSPAHCTEWNSPPINGQFTNHCIAIWWTVALRFNVAIKGLIFTFLSCDCCRHHQYYYYYHYYYCVFIQKCDAEMTLETSNASMVSGLVDFMSTLVSGSGERGRLDKPPPLPPKAHRVSSVDRAFSSQQSAKPVCVVESLYVLLYAR